MKTYLAYLFDMDGTLVNSEEFKGMALSETCKLFGGQAAYENYRDVMGENWSIVINHFFKVAQIDPDRAEFNSEFEKIYQKLLSENLCLNKGVINLLSRLKAQNKKIAVVSSETNWMVEQVLNQLELSKFFNLIIAEEQVENTKPDPEAIMLALNYFSISNSEALVFEDSRAGLIAAKKAGCDAIAFQHEFNVNHDLSSAIKTITDFTEVPL
jgi:HAD superfamily hydrolase (TIGR01509 family)